jgi:homoserine/homoserine lactone efflux protein
MSLELWLVYVVAAIGLSLTPGPNGLLSLTHGACFGFRPTIHTVLGGALGFFVLVAASLAAPEGGSREAKPIRLFNQGSWWPSRTRRD